MRIRKIWLLVMLVLFVAGNSYAGIDDDFTGSSLSPEWIKTDVGEEGKEGTVTLKQEEGKLLIQFANPKNATAWHGSELTQEVSYEGDFNISTHFSWETLTPFLGHMVFILKDAQGKEVAKIGLSDNWSVTPGLAATSIGGKNFSSKAYLSISDSADLRIERIKGIIYCLWGNNLIIEEKNTTPIKKVGFLFNTYRNNYFQPQDILTIDYIKELPPSETPPKKIVPSSQENLVKNSGYEEASSFSPSLPADYTYWSSLGWPKKAYLDDKNPHSGKYSLAIEQPSDYTGWQKLVQFLPKTYLPNTLYRLSFWGRTDGTKQEKMQITGNVYLYTYKNEKLYPLAFKTFTSTEWTYYYVDFISPIDNSYQLTLWVYLSPPQLAGVVWFDEISLVPVEESTAKKASQIKNLAEQVHQSIKLVKDSGYEQKMKLDLLSFDLEDFKEYKIIKEKKLSELKDALVRIHSDLEEGEKNLLKDIEVTEKKIASFLNQERISGEDLSKVEELIKQGKGYPERLTSLKKGIESRILVLENSIPEEKNLLAQKLKEEREVLKKEAEKEVANSSTGENLRRVLAGLKDKDSSFRASFALEAGRLQIKESIPSLIKLLDDESYKVRRNAIYALSWMQAKEAVPYLIKLTEENNDKWIRRRATQALGQIGDTQAVPVLIKLLSDADPAVKENSIYSLGWLKDKGAVSPLLALYEKEKERADDDSSTSSIHIRGDILQALGFIGDKSVSSLLISALDPKEDVRIRKDAAFALGLLGDETGIPYLNKIAAKTIYQDTFALQNTARFALYQLNKGKNKEPGIKQPDFLSYYDNFYYNTAKFHRAAGRWAEYSNIPKDASDMHRYAERIKVNDIITGGIPFLIRGDFTGEGAEIGTEIDKTLRDMDDKTIKCYPTCRNLQKSFMHPLVTYYGNYPAFAGFWFEEAIYGHLNPLSDFKDYLQKKYSSEELKKLGINLEEVKPYDFWLYTRQEERFSKPAQWTEFYEFKEEEALENWQELVEWLHGLRKQTSFIVSISSIGFAGSQSIKTYPQLSEVVDMNGIEPSYSLLCYDNTFMAELARDGEIRPVGMEVYAFVDNPPAKMYEAGIWVSALHAQQFFIWQWGRVFKYPGGGNLGDNYCIWQPGLWEALKRAFTGIDKVEEYLINTDSPHRIALVSSGRTNAIIYRPKNFNVYMSSHTSYSSYFSNLIGIYQALCQSHIQVDSIWTETLTEDKLKRYKVLVLPDAKSLALREENLLREWVKEGGFLITTGGTSLFDQWGRERDNYGLSDVLGVKFLKEIKRASEENVVINRSDTALGEMKIADAISFSTDSGYDLVEPTTGEVLATWGNGDPGMIKNSYGKGGSLFITSIYPGLHCKTAEVRVFPLRRDFYPGVRELLAEAVKGGLKLTNAEIPFVVENCPKEVEVVIRTQPDKKRFMLHLLNYNAHKADKVEGVKVKVLIPSSKRLNVFYPEDNQKIAHMKEGNYISFIIRDFSVHEMVVVEF